MKKKLAATLSVVLILGLAVLGILAYLTDQDSDVNVMTLGEVKIDQHEYERILNADGTYEMVTSEKYGEGYKLQDFTQDKPLYPATGAITDWGAKVPFDQIEGASGAQAVFAGLNNVQDKFVLVENTGKSDAYVRTFIALEYGSNTKDIIGISTGDFWTWNEVGVVEIKGNNYFVFEAIYKGSSSRHLDGVLPAGEYTYNSLGQIYLSSEATNEDCEALDGNKNGKYDILVLSQAAQTAGFANAKEAVDTAFGEATAANVAEWLTPVVEEYEESLIDSEEKLIKAIADGATEIKIAKSFTISETVNISGNVKIVGNGQTITRAAGYTGTMFNVISGTKLTLEDIILDGEGAPATGNLICSTGSGEIVLNKDTVLKNNNGAHAVSLEKNGKGKLTLNGAEIVNNSSNSGAIWGGGDIVVNEGSKISHNSSTGSAGAIRMVSGGNLTMNGGEISNNTATTNGGAIWGYGASVYNFNGGKISDNTAGGVGGGIYTGDYSTVNVSDDFEMTGNVADESGAFRLTNYTSFNMTGGKIAGNESTNNDSWDGFYAWTSIVKVTGGELEDNIFIDGNHTPTVGGTGITGVVTFSVGTNHNTINLAKDFGTIKFIVDEGSNFAAFNFKPAADYTYTAGDEAKLVCLNEGYETYWNAEKGVFKLQAK